MDNKFFTFLKPYLDFIDKGHMYRRPFSWLYGLIGVINLIIPLLLLYQLLSGGALTHSANMAIASILIWIGVAVGGWFSFQIWWDRMSQVSSSSEENDEFVATPVYSHLIQTLGEWIGTWIGVVGTFSILVAWIFLGQAGGMMLQRMGIPFLEGGLIMVILTPIYGFLLIVTSRFLAEQFRALASIANNTSSLKKDE